MKLRHLSLLISCLLTLACASPRVHRLTDFKYDSLPSDASVALYEGELKSGYEPVAIIDSKRYTLPDYYPEAEGGIKQARHEAAQPQQEEIFDRMYEELETLAQKVGADAVHKVRMLHVRRKGFVSDDRVPVPGARKQGSIYQYFMRGEAVKLTGPLGEEVLYFDPTEEPDPEDTLDKEPETSGETTQHLRLLEPSAEPADR